MRFRGLCRAPDEPRIRTIDSTDGDLFAVAPDHTGTY